jgi:hypothetical protein
MEDAKIHANARTEDMFAPSNLLTLFTDSRVIAFAELARRYPGTKLVYSGGSASVFGVESRPPRPSRLGPNFARQAAAAAA